MIQLGFKEDIDLSVIVVSVVIFKHEESGLIGVGESDESIAQVNILAFLQHLFNLRGLFRREQTVLHLSLQIGRLRVIKLICAVSILPTLHLLQPFL